MTTVADRRALATGVATTRQDPGLRAVTELWRSFGSPEHDLRDEAPSIKAPTLLIWGRGDPVIPLSTGRKAAAAIPGARRETLDAGHLPHTSDPDGFAALLTPFADSALDVASAEDAT
jgi:pimeloyl-ACP methyl ester carboxylesterase